MELQPEAKEVITRDCSVNIRRISASNFETFGFKANSPLISSHRRRSIVSICSSTSPSQSPIQQDAFNQFSQMPVPQTVKCSNDQYFKAANPRMDFCQHHTLTEPMLERLQLTFDQLQIEVDKIIDSVIVQLVENKYHYYIGISSTMLKQKNINLSYSGALIMRNCSRQKTSMRLSNLKQKL